MSNIVTNYLLGSLYLLSMSSEKVVISFKKRTHNQEKYSYLIGQRYEFDGLPGIGKSEFGKAAEYYLNKEGIPTKYFPEYVPKKYLNLYLHNDEYKQKYAASFQMIMAERRLVQTKKAEEFAKNGGFAIVDGPIIRDTAFEYFLHTTTFVNANGTITPYINDEEHEAYQEMMSEADEITEANKIVFFDGNVETLIRRIKKRGNVKEIVNYTPEILLKMRSAYKDIYDGISVTTLDYNRDCEIDGNYLSRDWIFRVLDAVRGKEYDTLGLPDYNVLPNNPKW